MPQCLIEESGRVDSAGQLQTSHMFHYFVCENFDCWMQAKFVNFFPLEIFAVAVP